MKKTISTALLSAFACAAAFAADATLPDLAAIKPGPVVATLPPAPAVETLFLNTSQEYMFLSSSIVKEVGSLGGDISDFVPMEIKEDIIKRIRER